MDTNAALQLLLNAHRLKSTPRTGWVMRGVAEAESVADHSFGVAFTALLLSEMVDQPLDKAKLLTMALLHDLPESVLSDLPSPASRFLPPGAKRQAEAAVLDELLRRCPSADRWYAWWQELKAETSVESLIIHDADRLDMIIQAHVYEQTRGNRWLEEFWSTPGEEPFKLEAARALYEALLEARSQPIN